MGADGAAGYVSENATSEPFHPESKDVLAASGGDLTVEDEGTGATARVAGYSPMQLIFGKEISVPGNLMEAIAGQFQFKVSQPQTMDEAYHRAAAIRRAATEAYQWLEANEALKRAAGSRSRLPRMELLVEGTQ
ncbi:9 kDa polypeptide (PSI-C) (Photosystem I iron-sulfur center) (Photosystem I subunit VII) (PsaC), partial [Durusdinium trenchii]